MNTDDLVFINDADMSNNCFDVCIADNTVIIECQWDYGHAGHGREICKISFETLEKLMNEYKSTNAKGASK